MKNYFTLDGIVEVTDGSYKGKYFVVDSIDNSHPTLQSINCTSLSGNVSDFKFDQACARQIGILTIRTIIDNKTPRLNTILQQCLKLDLPIEIQNEINNILSIQS